MPRLNLPSFPSYAERTAWRRSGEPVWGASGVPLHDLQPWQRNHPQGRFHSQSLRSKSWQLLFNQGLLVTPKSGLRGPWATNNTIFFKKQGTFLFTKFSFCQTRSYHTRLCGFSADTWRPKLWGLRVLTREMCQQQDTPVTQCWSPSSFPISVRTGKGGARWCTKEQPGINHLFWEVCQ